MIVIGSKGDSDGVSSKVPNTHYIIVDIAHVDTPSSTINQWMMRFFIVIGIWDATSDANLGSNSYKFKVTKQE